MTDARVSRENVEVGVILDPDARLSREAVEVGVVLDPDARLTREALEVAYQVASTSLLSRTAVEVAYVETDLGAAATWWDGTQRHPARVLGWWDGDSVEPLEDPVIVAPPFAPDVLTGLARWYDADDITTFTFSGGVDVSQWRDKSGSGKHFAQVNSTNQPKRAGSLNGRATLVFDGADDTLLGPALAFSHIFLVAKYSYSVFQGYEGLWSDSIGGLDNWTYMLVGGGGGTTSFYYSDHTHHLNGVDSGGTHYAPMAQHGVISASRSVGWNYVQPSLGTDRGIGGRYWLGEVAEVVIYSRVLSDAERVQVEDYLRAKWEL